MHVRIIVMKDHESVSAFVTFMIVLQRAQLSRSILVNAFQA